MSIADAPYVLTTTFRRSGEPVATPTWIAPLGPGRAGVITSVDAGKVKRLRHTPRVTLVPCSSRGRVTEGRTPVEAQAEVATSGPALEEVTQALLTKYGWRFRLFTGFQALEARVRRRPPRTMCGIVLSLPPQA